MGLGCFVNINIFVMKYDFFQFVYILHFFKSLKSKCTQRKETREFRSSKFWAQRGVEGGGHEGGNP